MSAKKHKGLRMATTNHAFWADTFEEHGSSILAFLTSRVGRRDLAEDLLQETFVRVMRQGDAISDSGNIRSYLFTTAYHLIVNHSRKKKPVLFSEVSDDDSSGVLTVVDGGSTAEELSDLHRLEERLTQVLATLPEHHRVAFESAVLRQNTYAEVARAQGWSLERVKTNVFRARKKVMERLRVQLRPHSGSLS